MDELSEILYRCTRLEGMGHSLDAVEELKDTIENALTEDQFDEVNTFLAELGVGEYSIALLIGILNATLTASEELTNRADFRERVRLELVRRKEQAGALLRNV